MAHTMAAANKAQDSFLRTFFHRTLLFWRKFSVNIRKLLIILFYGEIQVKSINTLAVFMLFWLLYTA